MAKAKRVTRKSTKQARAETIRRKQVRAIKYATSETRERD